MIPAECMKELRDLLIDCSANLASPKNELSVELLSEIIVGPFSCIKHLSIAQKKIVLNKLLLVLEDVYTVPNDPFHSDTIMHCIDGINNFLNCNIDASWFLPAPSSSYLSRNYHGEDYLALQLSQWSNYVVKEEEKEDYDHEKQKSILARSKYIFITWDLSNINAWDENLLYRLSKMLIPLAMRTIIPTKDQNSNENTILLHRLIILNWKRFIGSRDVQKKFFLHIWLPYFEQWTSRNCQYYISFIDETPFKMHNKHLGAADDHLELLRDVALFSFDNQIKKAAETFVLPSRNVSPGSETEYAALQFSKKLVTGDNGEEGFFALFLIQGKAAYTKATTMAEEKIFDRQNNIRNVLKEITKITGIVKNKSIIDRSKYFFRNISDTEKEIIRKKYFKGIRKSTFDNTIKRLARDGINFKPLNVTIEN